ncbi:helix-turn-helix domain-containing protein [Paenarthrobacter sp. MSM-2-10-13]|jgi:DNA-binding XRE family transcriptional regulator|uniref:helix-turn-helix transcriptional regulator n=1 Tax=Micrococcaceae TaxID=1268 RepID=UPI00115D03E9|nr:MULTISPECIES: helix-turn-helix domain-containing protein [Micrococcaceae]MCM0614479.1 helix-turn-helix domain-containing protein [Paenarthrobacter sp. TYUT067]NHW49138.1 helix-turn-helix domain-containing protein [Paenarthrobacter sp. MSM-2-10-13]TQS94412.1 helix-turn-helix domain-containing protein [Arthrobacter sp. TS-15]
MEHSDELTPFYRAVDAASLGRSIAEARKEAALTQHELAVRLGVTRGTIVRLEAGEAVSMVVAMQAIRAVGRDVALVPRFSKLQVRP